MVEVVFKLGGMFQDMSYFYLKFYEIVGKFDGCSLYDFVVVIVCIYLYFFMFELVVIIVVIGGEEIGEI